MNDYPVVANGDFSKVVGRISLNEDAEEVLNFNKQKASEALMLVIQPYWKVVGSSTDRTWELKGFSLNLTPVEEDVSS